MTLAHGTRSRHISFTVLKQGFRMVFALTVLRNSTRIVFLPDRLRIDYKSQVNVALASNIR